MSPSAGLLSLAAGQGERREGRDPYKGCPTELLGTAALVPKPGSVESGSGKAVPEEARIPIFNCRQVRVSTRTVADYPREWKGHATFSDEGGRDARIPIRTEVQLTGPLAMLDVPAAVLPERLSIATEVGRR